MKRESVYLRMCRRLGVTEALYRSAANRLPRGTHWGTYANGRSVSDRYWVCLDCGRVTRLLQRPPLIHNGRKPR